MSNFDGFGVFGMESFGILVFFTWILFDLAEHLVTFEVHDRAEGFGYVCDHASFWLLDVLELGLFTWLLLLLLDVDYKLWVKIFALHYALVMQILRVQTIFDLSIQQLLLSINTLPYQIILKSCEVTFGCWIWFTFRIRLPRIFSCNFFLFLFTFHAWSCFLFYLFSKSILIKCCCLSLVNVWHSSLRARIILSFKNMFNRLLKRYLPTILLLLLFRGFRILRKNNRFWLQYLITLLCWLKLHLWVFIRFVILIVSISQPCLIPLIWWLNLGLTWFFEVLA